MTENRNVATVKIFFVSKKHTMIGFHNTVTKYKPKYMVNGCSAVMNRNENPCSWVGVNGAFNSKGSGSTNPKAPFSASFGYQLKVSFKGRRSIQKK